MHQQLRYMCMWYNFQNLSYNLKSCMLMKAKIFFSVFSDHDQKHFLISGSHIRTSEFNASFYMVGTYVSISLRFRICTCLKSAQGWKWNFHVIISATPRNTCCEVKEKKRYANKCRHTAAAVTAWVRLCWEPPLAAASGPSCTAGAPGLAKFKAWLLALFFLNKLGTLTKCRSPLRHWQVESCGSELWG